ncbi:hypothetical protein BPUTEOMOX_2163 [methanotrophic endosymbiont of Bathymodiolus puteoserpentis (Logatchev)]|nr:hypothetical protein BPUTEOMOX_2163 [methanotrophic endosymbiont of Bathymodiolus puteoserpentis (Logatchev)]
MGVLSFLCDVWGFLWVGYAQYALTRDFVNISMAGKTKI